MRSIDFLSLLLLLIGVGLFAWAVLNPRWRYGHAQGATFPFVVGIALIVSAALLLVLKPWI